MKNKKAISPLIATVIIMGFTIALAFVVMYFGGGFIRPDVEEPKEKPECKYDFDCGYPGACIGGKCFDCYDDYDCPLTGSGGSPKCINNRCVSFLKECERVAMIDYGMENPKCNYILDSCFCKTYVIDSPEKRIEKGNSIKITPEQGHYENNVKFEIKNKENGRYNYWKTPDGRNMWDD